MCTYRMLLATIALLAFGVRAQSTDPVRLVEDVRGNPALAAFTVDTAPGPVSAFGLLGGTGELTVVENPRDLTMALRAIDGKNAFGLSITPARTPLAPMNVSTYNDHLWARVLAGTTLGYAQTTASIEGADYSQRAVSLETSFFLRKNDDPLILYWNEIETASGADNPCMLPAAAPLPPAGMPVPQPAAAPTPQPASRTAGGAVVPVLAPDELKEALDKRAADCRAKATAKARWNASRAWVSFATGTYRPEAGGASHNMGRVLVLGFTYGIGEYDAKHAGALTIAVKRTLDEPTLATLASTEPTRKNATLGTLRGSYGTDRMRVLLEGSRLDDGDPTASQRTFKRALGLDVRVAPNMWLNFRAGKQRRIDNNGDETGSTVSLSYSPAALLKL